MFESQELDCVFMETHMNPRRRLHMVLECIPLPRELGDMAPIYFKVCLCTIVCVFLLKYYITSVSIEILIKCSKTAVYVCP